MTEEQATTIFLVNQLGQIEAEAHVMFVLFYEYGLSKEWQYLFWRTVLRLIIKNEK